MGLSLYGYLWILSNINPPRIRSIPTIFTAVNTSLKMKKEAANMKIYTRAVDTGIIKPRSFFDIR